MTDEMLAANLPASLGDLYTRHERRVRNYLRKHLQERFVDDCTQEVFIRLVQRADHFDPARAFLPWFYVLIRSTMIDHLRREMRHVGAGEIPEHAAASPSHFDELIESLSYEEQTMLRGVYQDRKTLKELAETAGVNYNTYAAQYRHVLQKLRADELRL